MAKSIIKNSRKLHAGPSTDPSLDARVYYLENNEYKVTYYEVVSGASGTLTVPTSTTINEGEFGSSGNAILSEIDVNQKPTFKSPQTAGGVIVTASLNATTGAWLASGVYTSSNVALIYSVSILAKDYQNLNYDRIVESEELDYDLATQAAVDTGTANDQIVTPKTLANSVWAFTTSKVLSTVLTGLNTALTGAIVSTDTILQAFGKLQYQLNNIDLSAYELIANKSSSYTASSTTTYANTKALVDGLATKVTLTGNESISGVKTFTDTLTLDGIFNLNGTVNSSLSGANARIPSHTKSNITFTNAGLTSIASANNGGVVDGHILILSNSTGNSITVVNNYGSAAANEAIFTPTGLDVIIKDKSSFLLKFNTTVGGWVCISVGILVQDTITDGVTNIAPSQNAVFDALALKSPIASPTFTGTVTSPAVILSSETASTIASFDASKNIKSLDTATYPSLTELSYVKGVTSALQTQLNAKLSSTTEMLLFSGASIALNLADSTVYYFGLNNGVSPSTTQGFNRFQFPRNFTVTKVILTVSQNTNYSNESTSLYLRESLTTDKTITTTLNLSSVGLNGCKVFVYSGLSISVSSGLDYEPKLVTPAYTTNGTNSRFFIQIWGY